MAVHTLDLKELLKHRAIVEGECTETQYLETADKLIAQMSKGYEPTLGIRFDGIWQNVPLASRETICGRRWFFVDDLGQRCETLYLYQGQYVSRKTAGIRYRQVRKLDRLLFEKDELQGQLKSEQGKTRIDVKRGKKLANRLGAVEHELEELGRPLSDRIFRRRARALLRRRQANERFETAKSMMEVSLDDPNDIPSSLLMSLFADLLVNTPRKDFPKPKLVHRAPSKRELGDRFVDLSVLRRLGYLEADKIRFYQLGWPKTWLGDSYTKAFFIIDLRIVGEWRAMFATQVGRSNPKVQIFWIIDERGAFGRDIFWFQDPHDGRISEHLEYANYEFFLPQRASQSQTG